MTEQQIYLKIESFLKYADKQLLDAVSLPGGRIRLFAANPESYNCNYAVINQWLDVDETIEAAEEEFAGRDIFPCRFYGAPDSVELEQLRPAFIRHGYSIKVLEEIHMMALCQWKKDSCCCEYSTYWQQQELTPEEKTFVLDSVEGEYALFHIQRQLRRGCGKMLFAQKGQTIVGALLYTTQGDTVMISDDYTPLDYAKKELVEQLVCLSVQQCRTEQKELLFARVKGKQAFALYETMGFSPVKMTPLWWAVKGALPPWLEKQS